MKDTKRRSVTLVIAIVCLAGAAFASDNRAGETLHVSLVIDRQVGNPVRHGLKKVTAAFAEKGLSVQEVFSLDNAQGNVVVVAGLARGSGAAAELLRSQERLSPPEGPEALLIQFTKSKSKKLLLISGSDDRGLMYALLDVADRIGWSKNKGNPLSEVRNARENPAVSERSLSMYAMQRKHVESFFHDEAYWARYLDMLAENRYNTFALLFGYSPAAFLCPPYPYLFDVDGFPDVKMPDLTKEQQRNNLRMLNRIIEMTHDRGLDFTLGIWDHIPHEAWLGFRAKSEPWPISGVPEGVTRENLIPYTLAALPKLFQLVPNLDAVQFRMHGESGLKHEEMNPFWTDVYKIFIEHAPGVRLDARAKGLSDELIYGAIDMGVDLRVCTKYWMEQMGLPFHPTHIHPANQEDRRHGYADMLRYPKRYDMHWKLWNGGTTKILLWGDPEYARRFAESSHLYGKGGFEINQLLATKMAGYPEEEPFELLAKEYQYYDWEFERYWHFFQVFGRMGYNPNTPAEVWKKEFEKRFGKNAAPYVEKGLHSASRVLPMVVSYSYPYNLFSTLSGAPELRRQKDLPEYAAALPSDVQQFLSMDEAALEVLEGTYSAKILPSESSKWFAETARDILKNVKQAESLIGEDRNKEFNSTMVDLNILAHLSLYHSHRAQSGESYALFVRSDDLNALDDAIVYEEQAIEAWRNIVKAAGDVYYHNLMFGRTSGHWSDVLVALEGGMKREQKPDNCLIGLSDLQKQRSDFQPKTGDGKPKIAHIPVRKIAPEQDLAIRVTVGAFCPLTRVRVGFRGPQSDYEFVDLHPAEKAIYTGVIPRSKVSDGMRYYIEATCAEGHRSTFPTAGASDPIAVAVTTDTQAPVVKHKRAKSTLPGEPLTIRAEVRDPSGVKWVRLRYRSVNQHQDYKSLDMVPTDNDDRFSVVVGAEDIVSQWDFMYLIEVMDNYGNGRIYPDLEKETPYIVVKLER